MALASTVYMSVLGRIGPRTGCQFVTTKLIMLQKKLAKSRVTIWLSEDPFFNEFTIECPVPVDTINNHLLDHGILGGYDLSIDYPSLENHMLIAVTEMNSKEDIDSLVEVL